MKKEYLTHNSFQTKKLGEILAKEILKTPLKRNLIIGLEGDLGGGKTTFLQGFAKGLGIKEKILSPSFVLMKKFKINHRFFKFFYHIDCYRFQKPKEILNLGIKNVFANPRNLVAIEWADRIQKIIPEKAVWIRFLFEDKNKRKIIFRF